MEENKEVFNEVQSEQIPQQTNETTECQSNITAAIKDCAKQLVDKLNEVNINEETVKKYVSEFSNTVDELIHQASAKVEDLKNDPKSADFMNKAQQTYVDFTTRAKEVYEKTAAEITQADVKTKLNQTVEKSKEVMMQLSDRYQQFVHDPKVQKVVLTAVDVTKDVSNRAFGLMRSLYNKVVKEKEE